MVCGQHYLLVPALLAFGAVLGCAAFDFVESAECDATSLLQASSLPNVKRSEKIRVGSLPPSAVTKLSSSPAVSADTKDMACKGKNGLLETVPVKNSRPMPARGFITCCNTSITKSEMLYSLKEYLKSGGRLIDTAPDYTHEDTVGAAVQQSTIPRDELWLSSKVDTDGWRALMGNATAWTLAQVEKTLKIMNLTYLDSMTLHFGPKQVALQVPKAGLAPSITGTPFPMPKEQTVLPAMPPPGNAVSLRTVGLDEYVDMWRGLIQAKKMGKIRTIGVSETSRPEIEKLISETGEAPAIAMLWYNPFTPKEQTDFKNELKKQDIAVVAYGLFNWKSIPGGDTSLAAVKVAQEVADRHNATSGQLAIRWALDQGVAFASGMYHPEYLKEDLSCLDFKLGQTDHDHLATVQKFGCDLGIVAAKQYISGCLGSAQFQAAKSEATQLAGSSLFVFAVAVAAITFT